MDNQTTNYAELSEAEAVALFPRYMVFRNGQVRLDGHIIGHLVGLARWNQGRFDSPAHALGHITRLNVNPDGSLGVFVQFAGAPTEPEVSCHPGNLVYL